MVQPTNYYSDTKTLDSMSLEDVLLNGSLAHDLVSLGLECTCDLWVLALGELIKAHPEFSNLLDRISRDFVDQRGVQEHGQYKTGIEFSSALETDKEDSAFYLDMNEGLSECTTARVTLSIKVSQHVTVHWEAILPDSSLSEDTTPCWYSEDHTREFCLHFVGRARSGDVVIRQWACPPANCWDDLLPKPTTDLFVNWLNSTRCSERDLTVFQKRMELASGQRKTLEEVGQEFGLTRERVRQIINRLLKHLSHPNRRKRLTPLGFYLKKLFYRHGGIMTLREISSAAPFAGDFRWLSPMPSLELILHCCGMFSAVEYDYESGRGFSDSGSVTWHLKEIELETISTTRKLAAALVDKEPCKYSFEELVARVSAESHVPVEITRASLRTSEWIEQDSAGLTVATNTTRQLTVPTMAITVLREEIGVPAHFTVIAEKINKRFPERNSKPNHVLNCLSSPLFRWVERGTYGLAEWGLREIRPKEDYAAGKRAVREALQTIGRPATIREIEECLDRIKDEDESFMLLSTLGLILHNNPQLFVSLGQGKWCLVEWGLTTKPARDTISLACEILADDKTAWLTSQQLYMQMKSRGWTAPIVAVQRALDREVAKPKRRIRREELHGFRIQLYGLSSRDWNEEAVLDGLLAD